jgi:hypothetical protein
MFPKKSSPAEWETEPQQQQQQQQQQHSTYRTNSLENSNFIDGYGSRRFDYNLDSPTQLKSGLPNPVFENDNQSKTGLPKPVFESLDHFEIPQSSPERGKL